MSEVEFAAWIAAMPDAALERRIAALELELQGLRALKQVRDAQAQLGYEPERAPVALAPPKRAFEEEVPKREIDPARLSAERRQIIRALRSMNGSDATPAEVTQRLRSMGVEADDTNVATNMQRMRTAGLLTRTQRGRYAVVPEADELAKRIDAQEPQAGRLEMNA